MTEVEKITKQIEKYKNKINILMQQRQEICIHENIEYDTWQPDDWAFPCKYEDSYKCKDCGIYANSINVNDTYKILGQKYWDEKYKEMGI